MNTERIQISHNAEQVLHNAVLVAVKQVVSMAAGIICATASFEGLAPFGVSLAAAISPEYIPAAVLGSAVGYFGAYGISVLTLRYIGAAVIAGLLAFFFKRQIKARYHRYFSAVSGFFPLFVTGLIISLSVTLSADELLLYAAEGAVGCLAAWFFSSFFGIGRDKKYAARLTGSELAAVLIVFGILLLSLSGFTVFVFSPGVIVGMYVILASAVFGGEKYGALTGICAGVVLGLSGKSAFLTGGLAMSGLLVGLFGRRSRFLAAVIGILTVSVTAFFSDNLAGAANAIYSVGVSSLLFLFTPKKLTKVYKSVFSVSSDGVFLSGQRNVLRMRLHTASDGMKNVTESVKGVAGIYRRRTAPKEEAIYENVCGGVCKKCEKYSVCWNENYGETMNRFHQLAGALKRTDTPDDSDLPYRFFDKCHHPDTILKALGYEIESYRTAMRECAKTGETVNLVSDQFGAVSELLDNFSAVMESEEEYDTTRSDLVRGLLENDLGLSVISCGVFRQAGSRTYCEICFPSGMKYDAGAVAQSISRLLDMRLDAPVTRTLSDGVQRFCVCERTKYHAESGGFQIVSDGGKWCGDTFDSFYDGKGRFIMILSDGMGTGKRAAADSVMCCSLASILLRAGYPTDSILKMINAAMLVRSGEESLATLDIAQIDLYSGDVRFYKAGAGFSVAMRHRKLLRIEKPSLPVGILRNVRFEKLNLTLADCDTVVLMSDGVTEESVSMWREILHSAEDYEGKELSEKLARTAHLNAGKDASDDITVLTATLTVTAND